MAEDLSRVLLEEHGNLGLRDSSFGDADDEVVEVRCIGIDLDSIELEKCQRCSDGSALVSVEERMIATDVEQIGSRHFEKVSVDKHALESRRDHADRVAK